MSRETRIDKTNQIPEHDKGAAPPDALDRRAFLKLAGFTLGGAAISGCTRGREEKLIPYLVKPEEITPGKAYWYASTCGACSASCGILTKNRDGRPIKLEGLPDQPVSRGGLCAVGQASVLSLYDSQRLKSPLASGIETTWKDLDAKLLAELEKVSASGKSVRFLSRTITSPTLRATVEEFLSKYPGGKLVEYDPLSASALLDAQGEAYGVRLIPRFHFDRAKVIVSMDADFLGTWISPVEYTASYSAGRKLEGSDSAFSYHAQIESRLSVTGSKADERWTIRPSESTLALAHIASAVARLANITSPWGQLEPCSLRVEVSEALAAKLWSAPRGETLVVCGTNDLRAQRITAWLNHTLGNTGDADSKTTVDLHRPSQQLRGSDGDLTKLLQEIQAGEIGTLLIHDVNPAYDLPATTELLAALGTIPLVVTFAERVDETAEYAHFVCPDHHYLESWNDAEPHAGIVTIAQPALRPLGNTRSVVESLTAWTGNVRSHHAVLRDHWRTSVLNRSPETNLDMLWDAALQKGFVEVQPVSAAPMPYRAADLTPTAAATAGLELQLYAKIGLRDGRDAHNAWLQELPDPISKVTWDNYASISPDLAEEMSVESGDVIRLTRSPRQESSQTLELPALVQPGQNRFTVALALGYGRKGTDRFMNVGPQWIESRPTVDSSLTVGVNVAPLLSFAGDAIVYGGEQVEIARTGVKKPLARTQQFHSLDIPENLSFGHAHSRPIVQETSLAEYKKDPTAGSHGGHDLKSMWSDDHTYEGHHWAMAVDLSRCTGCSACVVGCQAENNVPVVGKDEVARSREMSWIRIDRYYSGDGDDLQVSHQPMMCQHCDNAPCENVCPVLATLHSNEGLNQQVYNRCVGTRYCANNCPYKTRRFNWFNYPHEDQMENMVLNPDVVVRSRGVMEKCSFCVQRIQEAKFEAKREGRELRDGDIKPACVQSCPAQAIVFGDRNDRESAIARQRGDPRHYHVLEELNVLPSVGYLRTVRNRDGEESSHG